MLHLDLNSRVTNKIFLELRYKEIFSLPENKFKILDKLSNKFNHFDANQPDNIIMIDSDKGITVHIFINRLTIDWDKPPSIDDFLKYCNNIIRTIKSVITIEEPKRIGIRTFLGIPVDTPSSADNYIWNKYFNSNVRNITGFADEIHNPRLQFSGRKGNLMFNFGVVLTQEQIIQGPINQPIHGVVNNYLTYDVDVYKEAGINVNNLDKFFNDTLDFVKNKIIDYIKNSESLVSGK